MWRIVLLIGLLVAVPRLKADDLRYSLSSDPWAWLVGPNARVDVRLSEHWSAGLGFLDQNRVLRAVDVHSFQPGAAISYAFSQALDDGWILDFSIYYGSVQASYVDDSGQTDQLSLHNLTTRLVAAHQWYFGHFGVEVGAGEELNSAGNASIYNSAGQAKAMLYLYPAQFILDLSLSLAF